MNNCSNGLRLLWRLFRPWPGVPGSDRIRDTWMQPPTNRQRLYSPTASLSAIRRGIRAPNTRRGAAILFLSLATFAIDDERIARALTFQLTYDSSASSAPAAFCSAFDSAIQFYQKTYTDPTITSWGNSTFHSRYLHV